MVTATKKQIIVALKDDKTGTPGIIFESSQKWSDNNLGLLILTKTAIELVDEGKISFDIKNEIFMRSDLANNLF